METYIHIVQYYETDKMGCVHHSNYIRWFEEARCFLLDKIGCGYKQLEETGIQSPVTGVQAQYKSMSRFGERVEILTGICSYTGSRIVFSYTVRDSIDKTVRCQGKTHHCFIGENGRPLSLKRRRPEIHNILCENIQIEEEGHI